MKPAGMLFIYDYGFFNGVGPIMNIAERNSGHPEWLLTGCLSQAAS
jgi:hypothetical protein